MKTCPPAWTRTYWKPAVSNARLARCLPRRETPVSRPLPVRIQASLLFVQSACLDSNQEPQRYKLCALTIELQADSEIIDLEAPLALANYFSDRFRDALVEHVWNYFIGGRFRDECRYRARGLKLHIVRYLPHMIIECAAEYSGESE